MQLHLYTDIQSVRVIKHPIYNDFFFIYKTKSCRIVTAEGGYTFLPRASFFLLPLLQSVESVTAWIWFCRMDLFSKFVSEESVTIGN